MDKTKLLKKALSIHLNTRQEVLDELSLEWDHLAKMIKHLKKIDVTNVVPMTRIDETPITSFRPDEPKNKLQPKTFFENAPQEQDHYVMIKQVENND